MADKKYRRSHCWCGTPLRDDGMCHYKCDPKCHPSAWKARPKKTKPEYAGVRITDEERKRTSDAIAKFDPIYREQRRRLMGASVASHKGKSRR